MKWSAYHYWAHNALDTVLLSLFVEEESFTYPYQTKCNTLIIAAYTYCLPPYSSYFLPLLCILHRSNDHYSLHFVLHDLSVALSSQSPLRNLKRLRTIKLRRTEISFITWAALFFLAHQVRRLDSTAVAIPNIKTSEYIQGEVTT